MDNRFPHMVPIDRLPSDVRRPVEEVCRREGVNAAWDIREDYVFFYLGDNMCRGLFQYPAGRWEPHIVDDILADIRTRHKPAWLKNRESEWQETTRKSDRAKELEQVKERVAPEIKSIVEHKRNRRDMGSGFKGSAVVSGLKEK